MKKESVDMRSLKKNGAVTFTSESSQLKQLLIDCQEQELKVRVERFRYFVSVVLVQKNKRKNSCS